MPPCQPAMPVPFFIAASRPLSGSFSIVPMVQICTTRSTVPMSAASA